MGLQVKLIIHGVPAGQKWLGADNDRVAHYIQTLYNKSEWDVLEFMKVERVADCVYYSFIKCGNVCAHDGRKGSYFGITMRMNVFYADIQNIYSILQATYKKLCVGVFVRDNGKSIQFLAADFNALENKYAEISSMTLDALGSFTSQTDLQQVGQIANTGGTARRLNLFACSESVASQSLLSTGCLKVSPYYPSPEVMQLKSDYAYKLDQAQKNHSAELQQLKTSYESSIQQMRQQQEQKEREFQGGTRGLTDKIRLLEQQMDSMKMDAQRKIDSMNSQLRKLENEKRGILDSLRDIVGKYATSDKEPLPPTRTDAKHKEPESGLSTPKNSWDFFYKIISFVTLLLLAVGFSFAWVQGSDMKRLYAKQTQQMDSIVEMLPQKPTAMSEGASFSPEAYESYRIDIDGLQGKQIEKGKTIDVTLLDDEKKPAMLNGEWTVSPKDALEIDHPQKIETSMTLSRNFQGEKLVIRYEVDSQVVKERELKVKR